MRSALPFEAPDMGEPDDDDYEDEEDEGDDPDEDEEEEEEEGGWRVMEPHLPTRRLTHPKK